jgi:ribosomal protein S8
MLLKRKYAGEFQHLLSSIKKSADRGRKTLLFKKRGDYNNVLALLVKMGFIQSYQEWPEVLKIQLKQLNKPRCFKAFVELHKGKRVGRKASVGLYELTKLQRRESGAAYYVLNTDRGVMTSVDAINLHIGGKILFRIV